MYRHVALVVMPIVAAGCMAVSGQAAEQQQEFNAQSQNAAHFYRQTAAAIEELSDTDKTLIDATGELHLLALYSPPSSWSTQELMRLSNTVPTDKTAAETVASLKPALDFFHQGAKTTDCDWGFDFQSGNLNTPIPHLPIVSDVVKCTVFRSRYYWAAGMKQEALNDLQALKTFATHVGAAGDGGLISLVVQFNIERVAAYTIAQWLVDPKSAQILTKIAQEPNRPPTNLARKALLLETEAVLPLAKRLIDTSGLTDAQRRERYQADLFTDVYTIGQLVRRYSEKGLLAQIKQSRDHYRHTGRLLDLPVGEFQPKFDKYMSEIENMPNFFSNIGLVECPGIERVYYDVKEMRVRWRMLQAAIDIVQHGTKAQPKHKDPFGDGPFEIDSAAGGFKLTSKLQVNGTPVSMQFTASPGVPAS